jgi:hypothetical protein
MTAQVKQVKRDNMQEHMTIEQYNQLFASQKVKNKYHARKVEIDGIKYDSQAEGDRGQYLILMQRARRIEDLKRQEVVVLSCGITWRMDFTYYESGCLILEDVKGCMTKDYKLKRKLLLNDIKSGAINAIYRETKNGISKDYGGTT